MTYRDEIQRKAIHLASSTLPLLYWVTDRVIVLWAIVPLLALAIVGELLRHGAPPAKLWLYRRFGNLFRHDEAKALTGATYVMFANLVAILLFPKPVAIAALLFLSISDALASLVGRAVGGRRLFGKSLAGSGAFFLSAMAIGLLVLWDAPAAAIGGAAVATLIEALPLRLGRTRLDDNLTIPLVAGGVMSVLIG